MNCILKYNSLFLFKERIFMFKMVNIVEDNDKYIDPSNTSEILNNLQNIPTLGEVKKLIDEVFPSWIITTMNIYCSDYPHLMTNWIQICRMSGVEPKQIIIVDDIVFDDSHTLIKAFSECFTRSGFVVRRKNEYISCEKCCSAVPTENMWNILKEKGFEVPTKWNKYCSICQ